MNATAARTRLENLLQWQAAPALTSDEVDDLFALVPQVADADGNLPDADGYTATYPDSVLAYREAAGQGWLWKAGKVAGQYGVSLGSGTRYDRQQQYTMCVGMAAQFGVKGGGRLGSARLSTVNTAASS